MPLEFIIARSPLGGSRLPYVVSLPLSPVPVVLATRGDWPVDKDLYCHELPAWPEGAEEVARVPVVSCRRRGSSVQLVLDRVQRRRSLFVWTVSKQGKPLVFWRSERSMRSTRPGVRAPHARGLNGPMVVVIDTRERYPWRFATNPVETERRQLPVGDYGVFDGDALAAVVERKKLKEFVGAAVTGKLQLAMAELAAMPRAAVIIEGRMAKLLAGEETRVRPGWLLNLTAALQAAYPNVPLLFAESAPLAADLAYRWLSACLHLREAARRGQSAGDALAAITTGDGPARTQEGPAPAGHRSTAAARPERGVTDTPLFASLADPPTGSPGGRSGGAGSTTSVGMRPAATGLFGGHAVDRSKAPLDRAGRQDAALVAALAGPLTVASHAGSCGVTAGTASTDLHDLVARGLLTSTGRARSLRFELTPAGATAAPAEPDGGSVR